LDQKSARGDDETGQERSYKSAP